MNKMQLKITQHDNMPLKKEIDGEANWIAVFPESMQGPSIARHPYLAILDRRYKKQIGKKSADEILVTDLPNTLGSRMACACVSNDINTFELLTLARKLVAIHIQAKAKTICLTTAGFDDDTSEKLIEAIIAAAAAAAAVMPNYKSKQEKKAKLKRLLVFGIRVDHGFKRTLAEAEGNAVARYLSQLPPNELTPTTYLESIRKLADEYKWDLEFYDEKTLQKKQAGAFLAVVQGSPAQDAGIVRLHYTRQDTSGAARKKLALVGKGLCYDTGGTNLKPAKHMYGMHEDMQGSAVALGALIALSRLQVAFDVECWLALAMNDIGPKAYKPNDVVTASDGTSIEVIHTDAEGRMVLADTLVLASAGKVDVLIDYATLTGACVYSLGNAYSGVFTNQDAWLPTLIQAGRDSGERVWPFPMDTDYDKDLESKIADIKQCAVEGNADHILAARFLQHFVKNNTPWLHVDLAASSHKGGLAHIPTDTTGFGIRFTLNLLLDKDLLSVK